MRIRVSFETDIDDVITPEEIDAWANFSLGFNGSIQTEVLEKFPNGGDIEALTVDWEYAHKPMRVVAAEPSQPEGMERSK